MMLFYITLYHHVIYILCSCPRQTRETNPLKYCLALLKMNNAEMRQRVSWPYIHCLYGSVFRGLIYIVFMAACFVALYTLSLWQHVSWPYVHCLYGAIESETRLEEDVRRITVVRQAHCNAVGYHCNAVGYHCNAVGYHCNAVGYHCNAVGYHCNAVGYHFAIAPRWAGQ